MAAQEKKHLAAVIENTVTSGVRGVLQQLQEEMGAVHEALCRTKVGRSVRPASPHHTIHHTTHHTIYHTTHAPHRLTQATGSPGSARPSPGACSL